MTLELTIEDDRAAFDALDAKLRSFDGQSVFVGLFGAVEATKGWRHELGEGVDERPWLAPATDQATDGGMRVAQTEIGHALDGDQTANSSLEDIGEHFEVAARFYIEGGKVGGKDLKKAARRNDTRKLVDSGDMVDAIETKVARSIQGEES